MRLGRLVTLVLVLVVVLVAAVDGTSPYRTGRDLEPIAAAAAAAAADTYFRSASEEQAGLAARRRVDELDADFLSFAVETGGAMRVTVGRRASAYVLTHLGISAVNRRFEVEATAVAAPRVGAPPAATTSTTVP